MHQNSTMYIKKLRGGGGLKSYVPVIEDFGLGKTVIEPKTLGTTVIEIKKISNFRKNNSKLLLHNKNVINENTFTNFNPISFKYLK